MTSDAGQAVDRPVANPVNPAVTVIAWLWVVVPFVYGLYELVVKIPALFGS